MMFLVVIMIFVVIIFFVAVLSEVIPKTTLLKMTLCNLPLAASTPNKNSSSSEYIP